MCRNSPGFTLLEMSIVITIIGLIIGGVLVGRDLIDNAKTNATIAQIQKYEAAATAFHDQYNALPGDMPQRLVTAFNFTTVPTRAGVAGRGDGNGVIEGYNYGASSVSDCAQSGETAWFWEDLSSNAGMIEGGYNYETDAYSSPALSAQPPAGTAGIASILPAAKLGGGNFIFVYAVSGINYYGIQAVTSLDTSATISGGNGLTVMQAYNIDRKIDDGLPGSGNVIAQGVAAGNPGQYWFDVTTPRPGIAGACTDNNNTVGATYQYSIEVNGGKNPSCPLSFQFN